MDLIDHMEAARTYPDAPGWKARDTARDAAAEVSLKAPHLRQLCLQALGAYGNLTADECAQRIGVDKLSVRPRFSELSADSKVFDSGERRTNASGKKAVVWSLTERRQ